MSELLQDIGLFAISFTVSFLVTSALTRLNRKKRHD